MKGETGSHVAEAGLKLVAFFLPQIPKCCYLLLPCGSWDETQVLRLGSKHLQQLTRLPSPCLYFVLFDTNWPPTQCVAEDECELLNLLLPLPGTKITGLCHHAPLKLCREGTQSLSMAGKHSHQLSHTSPVSLGCKQKSEYICLSLTLQPPSG